jgi:hypothetical protein
MAVSGSALHPLTWEVTLWACEDLNLGPLPYQVPPDSSAAAVSGADLERHEHRLTVTVTQLAPTSSV